jgi:hypothetical protein
MITEPKIKLQHPAGKKAVSMDRSKYDPIRKAILNQLAAGPATHKGLVQSVSGAIKNSKTGFQGSVEWHMEWVKLDLESRKEIKRSADGLLTKYRLA